MNTREAMARLEELFRSKLQAERTKGHVRAQVSRTEIVGAVEGLGLTDNKAANLAFHVLTKTGDWVLLPDYEWSDQRGFMWGAFTDPQGRRELQRR